jgi:hypothetical protein
MVRGLKSRLKMLSRVFVRNRFLLSVGLSVATGLVVRSVIQIPDSDPLLRYAAFERPAMYQAFIVSYALFLFTTPFLLLSMCLSLVYIHFYEEQIQQAAGLTPPYPKPEFRKELFLILGELHEQVEPVPAAHPKWLNIPERGLYTGIAALGAIGSGKTRGLILPDSEKKLSGIVLEVKGDLCRHLRRILKKCGREQDYIDVSLDSDIRYNPLNNSLDPYAQAFNIASIITSIWGKGKEPFWQQSYTDASALHD